jgi:hypothetical protein
VRENDDIHEAREDSIAGRGKINCRPLEGNDPNVALSPSAGDGAPAH